MKRLVRPMLDFKSFWAARCTIAGIEVMYVDRRTRRVITHPANSVRWCVALIDRDRANQTETGARLGFAIALGAGEWIQNNGPVTSTLISPPLIAGARTFISSMR